MKGKVTKRLIAFVDNLDRNKTGRVLFGIGIVGFMAAGSCLDSKHWGVALLGVMASVGIAYIGYQMTDLTKAVKWESKRTREKKQQNRESTYSRWIQSTNVTMK